MFEESNNFEVKNSRLWGEMPPKNETESWERIVPRDRGRLVIMSAIKPEPPKTYQPIPDEACNKLVPVPPECSTMEPTILETIKLLQHMKKIREQIGDSAISEEDLVESLKPYQMPSQSFSEMRAKRLKLSAENSDGKGEIDSDGGISASLFTSGKPVQYPKLTVSIIKQILQKTVAALVAHAGFDNSMDSALQVLTDVAADFLRRITVLMRTTVDKEVLQGPGMYPDAMECVFRGMGIEGGVRSVEEYYRIRVIGYREKVRAQCQRLSRAAPRFKKEEGDVPEFHVPAGSDGDGLDDLQPSLEPEYRMLEMLEQVNNMSSQLPR